MTASAPVVVIEPPGDPLASLLVPLAEHVCVQLELAPWLSRLVLVPDDVAADERPWLQLQRDGERHALVFYFHPDAIVKDHPALTDLQPPPAVWELGSPAQASPTSPEDFAPIKAQRLLHHHLLWARDLCDGTLRPADVPASLAEAFQEAWSVTVDGRLRRAGLPGLSEGERRIRFLRLFATGGVVIPAHWQVFHELWSGEAATQSEVLRRVKRLPPLPRRAPMA